MTEVKVAPIESFVHDSNGDGAVYYISHYDARKNLLVALKEFKRLLLKRQDNVGWDSPSGMKIHDRIVDVDRLRSLLQEGLGEDTIPYQEQDK
jgi:hypothetical protein